MTEEKETKPQIGNIMLKEGKASIVTKDGNVTFDMAYVIDQIRKALKDSRPGYYTTKIRTLVAVLREYGLDGIETVDHELKTLSAGRDINREFIKQIQQWLSQLKMFSKIKTTPKEEAKNDSGN